MIDRSNLGLVTLSPCPEKVKGSFHCCNNELNSLMNAPKTVYGDFCCHNNQLTDLKMIHKHISYIGGTFIATKNPLKSNVLGLFFIKGLTEIIIDNTHVSKIINEYLRSVERDMHLCQEDLIEAGLGGFARA